MIVLHQPNFCQTRQRNSIFGPMGLEFFQDTVLCCLGYIIATSSMEINPSVSPDNDHQERTYRIAWARM